MISPLQELVRDLEKAGPERIKRWLGVKQMAPASTITSSPFWNYPPWPTLSNQPPSYQQYYLSAFGTSSNPFLIRGR